MTRKKKGQKTSLFWEYFESVVIAVMIAIVLRTFVLAAYKIPTASMIPTLKIGDCLFAWKLPFGLHIPMTNKTLLNPKVPHRGDVVVFKYPEDPSLSFVKRVIGIPGDKVEIRQKRVFVNDQMFRYTPTSREDEVQLRDIPSRDLYIIQKEVIDGKPHFVMFKRGEDDDSYGPIAVPDGKLFVMGDNRDSSDDSRSWGLVPMENLEGQALVIWVSLNWDKRGGSLNLPRLRTERLFSLIH